MRRRPFGDIVVGGVLEAALQDFLVAQVVGGRSVRKMAVGVIAVEGVSKKSVCAHMQHGPGGR